MKKQSEIRSTSAEVFVNNAGISIIKKCISCDQCEIVPSSRHDREVRHRCRKCNYLVETFDYCPNWQPKPILLNAGSHVADVPPFRASRYELLQNMINAIRQEIELEEKRITERWQIHFSKLNQESRRIIREKEDTIREIENEMELISISKRSLSTPAIKRQSIQEYVNSLERLMTASKRFIRDIQLKRTGGKRKTKTYTHRSGPIELPKDRRACPSLAATILCNNHCYTVNVYDTHRKDDPAAAGSNK